jgi:hypothetical protein
MIEDAHALIFNKRYAVNSKVVENILKPTSQLPAKV